MKEASETVTRPIVPPQQQLDPKDKGKDRVARQREEDDNLISWDSTQAMMEADYELAQRLQAEEQGELTIEERSKLFVELMDKRKKHSAKLRAEEIRRKPPTKAQKRNQMITYLKNMANYKHSQLKNKSFEGIQMLFDNTVKWVDSFVPMDSEVVEGSKSQEEGKDDAEKVELKACLEIVPGDAIIRANGSAKFYKIFSAMLDDFDRQDVLDLYMLLEVDHECEMAYELLRFTKSQYKKIVGIKRHLSAIEVTAAGYISTADEVQKKYSKSLLLLVVKLLLLVLVTTARRVSAVRV
ncbi:hypothetical protein Tco_1415283 [Tanacetum coccineum]